MNDTETLRQKRVGRPKNGEPNPIDVHVGSRVRLRRSLLGMSQEKLGAALGVTFQQVQKYERGTNRISASRLWDIGRVLDVPLSFFFDSMPSGVPPRAAGAGLAEQDQAEFIPSRVSDQSTTQMLRAFQQIDDPEVRRRILELVRALCNAQENPTSGD